jgi:hypothetical protein
MTEMTTFFDFLSSFALIGALIFTGLQVRTANRVRAEQAALSIIHAVQTEEWTRTVNILTKIPSGLTAVQIDALGPEFTKALEDYGIREETFGYMVFRGFVSVETVDQLFGGLTVILWARIKPWAERARERMANPKMYEWVQWLAERLEDQHRGRDVEPAFKKHANWKQSDARPTY